MNKNLVTNIICFICLAIPIWVPVTFFLFVKILSPDFFVKPNFPFENGDSVIIKNLNIKGVIANNTLFNKFGSYHNVIYKDQFGNIKNIDVYDELLIKE